MHWTEKTFSACTSAYILLESQMVFLINLAGCTGFSVAFLPWFLAGAGAHRNFTPVGHSQLSGWVRLWSQGYEFEPHVRLYALLWVCLSFCLPPPLSYCTHSPFLSLSKINTSLNFFFHTCKQGSLVLGSGRKKNVCVLCRISEFMQHPLCSGIMGKSYAVSLWELPDVYV